jgi:iron-sulfur cluster assembly accessory protein
MTINITPEAASYIFSALSSVPDSALEVGYDDKGCGGHKYTYAIVLINSGTKDDAIVSDGDPMITVIIRGPHIAGLRGSTLRVVGDEMGSMLIVDNPMAVSTCGCGDSFKLDDDESAGGC